MWEILDFENYVNVKLYSTVFGILLFLVIVSAINWKTLLVDPNPHKKRIGFIKLIKKFMDAIPFIRTIINEEDEETIEMNKKLSLMTSKIRWADILAIRYATMLFVVLFTLIYAALQITSLMPVLTVAIIALIIIVMPKRAVNTIYKWYLQMMIKEIPTFLDTLMVALKAQSSVYDALKATIDSVRFMRPYVVHIVNGWGRSNETTIQEAANRLDVDEFYALSHMLQRALAYDRNKALTFFEKHAIYVQKFMDIENRIEMNKKSVIYVFAIIIPAMPAILFLTVPLVVRAIEALSTQF